MRLPLVSASRLREAEDREARWIARADAATHMLAAERRRFDALLARYHMLKLQGAIEMPPQPAPTPKRADPIAAAIDACSRGSEALAAAMRVAAKRDQQAGLSTDDIVARIHSGYRPMDDLITPVAPSNAVDAPPVDPGVRALAE